MIGFSHLNTRALLRISSCSARIVSNQRWLRASEKPLARTCAPTRVLHRRPRPLIDAQLAADAVPVSAIHDLALEGADRLALAVGPAGLRQPLVPVVARRRGQGCQL